MILLGLPRSSECNFANYITSLIFCSLVEIIVMLDLKGVNLMPNEQLQILSFRMILQNRMMIMNFISLIFVKNWLFSHKVFSMNSKKKRKQRENGLLETPLMRPSFELLSDLPPFYKHTWLFVSLCMHRWVWKSGRWEIENARRRRRRFSNNSFWILENSSHFVIIHSRNKKDCIFPWEYPFSFYRRSQSQFFRHY